jgi:uncharacterized protein
MDYRSGSIGRVLTIRFDHGDDFLEGLKDIIVKDKIKSGWFQILGAVRHADVVIGPEEPIMPPIPIWTKVDEAREAIGTGSVYMDGTEPIIHLHAALGHHGDTLTACVRKNTEVYLILEVLLFEITGIDASRPWWDKGGFNRLTFS